ncbi:bifunctional helix-turn-helix transcriptional regulator/GNAT family N-acetyltransferase [Devosia nitrariae]|uniref:MarR family transcriptional regulator n=1 Tax=Devosia nitrariae TaxID=2071872 RepID=A0ABQ5VZK7_9HYPH|nr:helix-turn-helix domain-containing GNAT family N-acetyltransferase [Devosia nitrariae]GLQ53252.1 MarR family transcriptional regulator [Devosia nitrariae]
MSDQTDDIAAVRRFNRFYTRIIGLLEEGMHRTRFTLSEARMIHEIGKRGATSGSELASELGMDPGQVSRLLWRLVDQDQVYITPGDDDRRRSRVSLTADGDKTCARLNIMSDEAAAGLLEPLDRSGRRRLVQAMKLVMRLLSGSPEKGPLAFRPHRIGELGWLTYRQALLYNQEYGWNSEFETLIARIYADYEDAPATPPKALWLADFDGEVAGSVFVVPAAGEEKTAQLRMLYVEPTFRGKGIGGMLVDHAVKFARNAGYRRMILWTQDCLVSARKIYQAAGFTLARDERHQSFGADLNGQYWVLDLEN